MPKRFVYAFNELMKQNDPKGTLHDLNKAIAKYHNRSIP